MGITNIYWKGKMAQVAVSALKKEEKDRLACTYAALLLHDGDLEISEEKLSKVLKASNNQVESYWPSLFAKAMKGQDVAKLLSAVGTAAPAAAGPAAGAGAAAPAEKKKEEEPEEADVDMGDLFGGGDDDY